MKTLQKLLRKLFRPLAPTIPPDQVHIHLGYKKGGVRSLADAAAADKHFAAQKTAERVDRENQEAQQAGTALATETTKSTRQAVKTRNFDKSPGTRHVGFVGQA